MSLLVQGAPLPAAARSEPNPAEPIAPTAFSCDAVTQIPKAECEALVALYNSTNGPGWKNSDGWLVSDTPCYWHGILCSGDIVQLELSSNQLDGSIPPQLANLANLGILRLNNNRLSGSIPAEFAQLDKLWLLHLENNLLSGIPPELADLSNLHDLRLARNRFSGNIPPELFDLSNLTGMDRFRLRSAS